ncbi:MAG: 1-(5-phosphoribosyl)-5-[(5-phosphoribosylamino)methylideneamino]imidazole-4-carboxamide isomerase [Sandaracinaceae bacterium]|nr:1-(5-phosphoribosyl)-5-[(5-phosphoribosylamino)methylideneamino]imidazole-4-carboxamide isomerase [Sandaracinaceae bacterium]
MELIPAIDLLGGRVVRLHKGDYDAATAYAGDPVAVALGFAEAGATRLHVVDLDGARGRAGEHAAVIARIVAAAPLAVQVGGGVRDRATAERWLEAGAARVVLGTVAVRDPAAAEAICAAHPGRVIVAIDARGDEVAVDGWREAGGAHLATLAEQADAWGAAAILYTDIERDGTGEGPATERTRALQDRVRATVIASGGIGSLAHVLALRDAGVRAAVCGRALYEGALRLEDALAALREAP